jgi:hypothetical protein
VLAVLAMACSSRALLRFCASGNHPGAPQPSFHSGQNRHTCCPRRSANAAGSPRETRPNQVPGHNAQSIAVEMRTHGQFRPVSRFFLRGSRPATQQYLFGSNTFTGLAVARSHEQRTDHFPRIRASQEGSSSRFRRRNSRFQCSAEKQGSRKTPPIWRLFQQICQEAPNCTS